MSNPTIPPPLPPEKPEILVARNLHKSYRMGKELVDVLKGVELRVAHAEVLGIVGASGAGKSTLMHVLGGLDRPVQGGVWIDGVSLYELAPSRLLDWRNQKMGFVFQSYQLLPELEAVENVALPGWIARKPALKVRRRAAELLDAVGLGDRMNHRPTELSGGEQQRVAIARALVNEPAILFADEPTGNLDSTTGAGVMELLLRLQRECGMTLVLVTHETGIARQCQRVMEIRDGMLGNPLKKQ